MRAEDVRRGEPRLRPGLRRLRTEWEARRLRLAGLPADVQLLAGTTLTACGAVGLLTIAIGTGLPVPGRQVLVAGDTVAVERAAIVACYVGLALAAAAAAAAAARPGWRLRRLTLVATAVVGAAIGAETVLEARMVADLRFRLTDGAVFVLFPHAWTGAAAILGWAAVVTAVVVALVPLRLASSRPLALAALAALPFVLALAAYALTAPAHAATGRVARDYFDAFPEQPRTAGGWVGDAGIGTARTLGLTISVLFLWQVVEAAHFARDAGVVARRLVRSVPVLFIIAVALKSAWAAAGYAGFLPAILGGASQAWAASRGDGFVAWLLALAFAGLVGGWLLRPRGRVSERGLAAAVVLVVGAMTLFALLAAGLVLVHPTLRLLPGHPFLHDETSARAWLQDHITWSSVVAVYGAALLAPVLLARRASRTVGVFLLAFAAWTLPRAIAITVELVRHPLSSDPFVNALEGRTGRPSRIGSVELVTLDTALTAMIVVLFLLARRRRARAVDVSVLSLVLVASTLSAYSGFLANVFQSRTSAFFYVGLVFPAAYEFLADSQRLNASGPRRAALVLGTVATAAALLTAALALVAVRSLDRNTVTTGSLGRITFGPPLLALLVAAVLTSARRHEVAGRPDEGA